MTAYKIKDESAHYAGRIIVNYNNLTILLGTPTKPQFVCSYLDGSRYPHDVVELEDVKWIHPHLYKPLKIELSQKLGYKIP